MTQEQIQHQIEVIKRGAVEVLKSPEASRRFLVSIGMIEDDSKPPLKSIKPKKGKL